jgi:DNA anti-recombination protein RmuC
VKTEFGKYGEVLDKVQQKLHEASNTIKKVSVRRRAIDRRLDQPEFYRFPVVGPKRSQIIYLALEGTKNPSEELSIAS